MVAKYSVYCTDTNELLNFSYTTDINSDLLHRLYLKLLNVFEREESYFNIKNLKSYHMNDRQMYVFDIISDIELPMVYANYFGLKLSKNQPKTLKNNLIHRRYVFTQIKNKNE